MRLNGDMLALAREYRARSQEELAGQAGVSQATIAKLEAGLRPEVEEGLAQRLAKAVGFPPAFLAQEGELLGFGSSAFYYRKKATIPAPERKRVHSIVNMLRLGVRHMLPHVEVQPKRPLPKWEIDDYGGTASTAARALRALWLMPDGPVKDLTALVESAGVLVIPCEFGANSVDATSLRLADMPPLVFMNVAVPGDRWRFTLAHELAHLVLHREPHEDMENEADAFAGEFLVPADEVRPQFTRLGKVQVRDLIPLKRYWRVSMQALVFRGVEAGAFTEAQKKSLFVRMSQLSMRQSEPEPLARETPSNLERMLATMTGALKFTTSEIQEILAWPAEEMPRLLPITPLAPPRHLRVV